MMRVTLIAVLALSCVGHSIARGQSTARWNTFIERFDSAASAEGVVGGTVRFLDGSVVVEHDFGVADRVRGLREGPGVVQHWASNTKMLTAIAIMQLRDRGLLSLDDPVLRWVPELGKVSAAEGSVADVTLRMLLSHTSGFPGGTWPWRRYAPWEPFEPTEWSQLVAMMPYMRLAFRPGARFSYSNPGYIYLARVIERVTGDPWEEYVHKNIFLPLGLTASSFRRTPWHLASLRSANYTIISDSGSITPQLRENAREFDPGITVPNSGWNAPVTDLERFARALMGPAGRAMLAAGTLQEMWTPTVDVPAGEYNGGAGAKMGLGFFVFSVDGEQVVGHTGDQAGFRSFVFLNPGARRAVIGVWNTENAADRAGSARRWEAVQSAARRLVAGR